MPNYSKLARIGLMRREKEQKREIYLDTAAKTPLDPLVFKVMRPYLLKHYANPSSWHQGGMLARQALEDSRRLIAGLLSAQPDEIIFTSGGTEGNNLALAGVMKAQAKSAHLITTNSEHASVWETAHALAATQKKLTLTILPVNGEGLIESRDLVKALRPETKLVSVIYANNEIGTIQPIRELAKVIRHQRQATGRPFPYFHIDACQAPRFLNLNVQQLGVDLMTLNGSKIYGPEGSGCLYVRRGIKLQPILWGGGQEDGRRSGTENVAGIVGLAKALEICAMERERESRCLIRERDYLIGELLKIEGVRLNGSASSRLPNNVNVSVSGIEGEQLVIELDARGIAVSTGSACANHHQVDHRVIIALGRSAAEASSAIRFTLGRDMKRAELKYIIKCCREIIKKIKSYASITQSAL